jgi:hypothetical protein
METVNVKVNVSSVAGRKLMREIEKHPRIVEIETEIPKKTYSVEDFFERLDKKLEDHYGVNFNTNEKI